MRCVKIFGDDIDRSLEGGRQFDAGSSSDPILRFMNTSIGFHLVF